MIQAYRIPHAISVFIDRSRPQAVLRAVAVKADFDTSAKREMDDALKLAALELGVKHHEIAWQREPEPKP